MRELKFRAWDIEQREWNKDLKILLDGTVKDFDWGDDGYYEFKVPKEEYIIEQYTGLKDKNGKEIYEGDIVQDGKGGKCRVGWTDSEAHFGLYVGKQMELTDFIWMRGEDLEVIGNIHENPELCGEEEE